MRWSTLAILFFIGPSVAASAQDVPAPAAAQTLTIAERIEQARGLYLEAKSLTDPTEQRQKLQAAFDQLNKLMKEDLSNVPAKILAAEILYEVNDYNSARELYKAVLKLDPSSFQANLGLGKVWIGNRLWRQAIPHLNDALKVAPAGSVAEVKRLLAQAHSGAGDHKQALETAEEILLTNPNDVETAKLIVKLLRDKGEFEDAAGKAETLVNLARDQWLGDPANRKLVEQLDEAYAMQMSVYGVERQDGLLQSYYERDNRDRVTDKVKPKSEAAAAATLVKIAGISIQQSYVKQLLALHDALVLARQAVKIQPENVEALKLIASLLGELGDKTGQRPIYERILDLSPTDPEALRFLSEGQPPTSMPTTLPVEQ